MSVRDLSTSPATVWETLDREDEVVVTRHGKPVALMVAVDAANLDQRRRDLALGRLRSSVASIQRQSVSRGLSAITTDDVDALVARTRITNRPPADPNRPPADPNRSAADPDPVPAP